MVDPATIRSVFGPLLDTRAVLWRVETPEGRKPTKVPYRVTGRSKAASNRPATWGSFEEASSTQARGGFDGPGIMLGDIGDGHFLVGIDLDACRSPTTGIIMPWAQRQIARWGSYIEVSPSGTGVKGYGLYHGVPRDGRKEITIDEPVPEGAADSGHTTPEIGLYPGYDPRRGPEGNAGRYFALTGSHIEGTPPELRDVTAAFDATQAEMEAASRGDKKVKPDGRVLEVDTARPVPELPPADLPDSVKALLAADPEIAAAWQSGGKIGEGKDDSASGRDFSLACWLHAHGVEDDAVALALRLYRHGQIGSGLLKGQKATRRIKRILAGVHKPRGGRPEWWDDLLLTKDSDPRDCIANVALALRAATEFAGRLRFDQLLAAAASCDMPWRRGQDWLPWTDGDDIALTERLQLLGLPVKKGTVADAVALVAGETPFHPVGAYLDGRAWDGTERLDAWLSTYLGVTDTPYSRAVGKATLVAGIARIRRPGCKADHVLILEGPQGAGKSQAVAALSPLLEWFTDEIADIGSKDAAQDLCGKWLIELPELSAMKRGEVATIKAFVARSVDHYRPSYGRRAEDFPRQCIFIGSTNADAYLADDTGNRRFWPVRVGKINLDRLRQDRDQLWAEAAVAFGKGARWWLDADAEALAKVEQADRQPEDPWTGDVLEWGDRYATFVIEEFLITSQVNGGLAMKAEDIGDREYKRVASILRRAGWERGPQKRINGARRRPYLRPSPLSPVLSSTGDSTGDNNKRKNINGHSSPVTPVTRNMTRTHLGGDQNTNTRVFDALGTSPKACDTGDRGDALIEELVQ